MSDRSLQKGLMPVVVNEDEKYFFHLECNDVRDVLICGYKYIGH
jgi:hypothetical protein